MFERGRGPLLEMNSSNSLNRTRLINFRVTPEEYERLRQASSAHGIGSFSDFAREVLLESARRRPAAASSALGWHLRPWMGYEERLAELEGRMEQVAGFIDHVARRLEKAARVERRPPRTAERRTVARLGPEQEEPS